MLVIVQRETEVPINLEYNSVYDVNKYAGNVMKIYIGNNSNNCLGNI